MRIRWSSDLETGVRAIDRQHEELIGMLNELDAAHADGCAQAVLDDVLPCVVAFCFRGHSRSTYSDDDRADSQSGCHAMLST